MKKIEPITIYQCPLCDYEAGKKSFVVNHIKTEHKGIDCKVCHPKPGGAIPVDNMDDPHCSACGRKL